MPSTRVSSINELLGDVPPTKINPPKPKHYGPKEKSAVDLTKSYKTKVPDGMKWTDDDSDNEVEKTPGEGCGTRFKNWMSDHKLITSGVALIILGLIGAGAFYFTPGGLDWLNHKFVPWVVNELAAPNAGQLVALGAGCVILPYLLVQTIRGRKDEQVEEEPQLPNFEESTFDLEAVDEATKPKPCMSKARIAAIVFLILAMGGVGFGIYSQASRILESYEVMVAGATMSLTLIGMFHYIKWAAQPKQKVEIELQSGK